jgi:glycyl-tRNA synthetase
LCLSLLGLKVILKPDPGNSQELFLGSLAALGIDTTKHDVRFVEDNWESPALGAWGLGWEVWLDGMEVTQFTYFQQAGGQPLSVPAVEITYGLERIVMSLQGVNHFKDIQYNPSMTYGEMFLQNEYEMSVYNLDEADVEDQRERFRRFDVEARRLLDKRLPVPAYDHLLKMSHAFNILDARGAVGVTERAACFASLRFLSREVGKLWVERRAELGHPLGALDLDTRTTSTTSTSTTPHVPVSTNQHPAPESPTDFVWEIGCEELPPDEVDSCVSQLRTKIPDVLEANRLTHAGVTVEGTPRRLVVHVHHLAARQTDLAERVRGPPIKVAQNAETGAFTPAALGFAKKNGITVEQLVVEDGYLWADLQQAGEPATKVLRQPSALPSLLTAMTFRKSMRWTTNATFSRPLRWMVAMHGNHVVPLVWGDVVASDQSYVLRNAKKPWATVHDASAHAQILLDHRITSSVEARREMIWSDVQRAAEAEGVSGLVPDDATQRDLLAEVANLVESPTVIRGGFDPTFLTLPAEVLVMVMKKHQRYFPVYKKAPNGEANANAKMKATSLLPYFITVANGDVDPDAVRAGNEAVLRARFADAQFFYQEDRKRTLAEVRPGLAQTLFQKDLGSLLDKSDRVVRMAPAVAAAAGWSDHVDVEEVLVPAATLARADLATSMVMEMTALAGVMGQHYAEQEGLDPRISRAIFESVLPRGADDVLPETAEGIVLAVADKMDSLVGLFAAKCGPTANTDPYGLRRAAVGCLLCLMSGEGLETRGGGASLAGLVAAAAGEQPLEVSEEVREEVRTFLLRRLEQILVDRGYQVEAVRAVLTERGDCPARAAEAARALSAALGDTSSALGDVMEAFSRPTRLTRGKELPAGVQVDPALFEKDEEKVLFAALTTLRGQVTPDMSLGAFLEVARELRAPVGAFMDGVFVMAEDEAVRNNRLALLRDVAACTRGICDLAELPGF